LSSYILTNLEFLAGGHFDVARHVCDSAQADGLEYKMLLRVLRNAIILHWSSLVLLEAIAIGTIVLVRVKRLQIARLLFVAGLSESNALRISRLIPVLAVSLPCLMVYVWFGIRVIILRRLRWKLGRCLQCNYDLTANTSGVCPECGTPVDPNLWPPPSPRQKQDED